MRKRPKTARSVATIARRAHGVNTLVSASRRVSSLEKSNWTASRASKASAHVGSNSGRCLSSCWYARTSSSVISRPGARDHQPPIKIEARRKRHRGLVRWARGSIYGREFYQGFRLSGHSFFTASCLTGGHPRARRLQLAPECAGATIPPARESRSGSIIDRVHSPTLAARRRESRRLKLAVVAR
jgi:hypothetical protein